MKNQREVKNRLCFVPFFCLLAVMLMMPVKVSAHQPGDVVMGSWGRVAGTYNAQGQIVLNVCTEKYKQVSHPHVNSNALDALCGNDQPKTIVIPAGSTVELENIFHIGSNTTIIADGATLVMKEAGKGIINNRPDAVNYQALENVRIQGGTWKTDDQSRSYSVMRFAHGNNLTIENATVVANYESHAIELIAMKNVVVRHCKLLMQENKKKNSVEEALQIDIASPKTAPGLVQFGSRYVQGQTCKNIQILNNEIEGSRGVCANYAGQEGKKYKNKFHDKITIIGNKMTGYSAEGCVIYNTYNAVVKNNVVKTFSTRKKKSYAVGFNVTLQGKAPKKQMKKARLLIEGNTIYGIRQGMQLVTMSGSKYKAVTVRNNHCYAPKKKNALVLNKNAASRIKQSNNQSHKR